MSADTARLAAHQLRLQVLNTLGQRVRVLPPAPRAGAFAVVSGVHAQTAGVDGLVAFGLVDVTLEGTGEEMPGVLHSRLQLVDPRGAQLEVERDWCETLARKSAASRGANQPCWEGPGTEGGAAPDACDAERAQYGLGALLEEHDPAAPGSAAANTKPLHDTRNNGVACFGLGAFGLAGEGLPGGVPAPAPRPRAGLHESVAARVGSSGPGATDAPPRQVPCCEFPAPVALPVSRARSEHAAAKTSTASCMQLCGAAPHAALALAKQAFGCSACAAGVLAH